MAILANNLRISLSSKITQNQSFDLTALFLRGVLSSEDSIYRGDAGANVDPFLFNLPTFDDQTFSLIIEDDLSASAGGNFSIVFWHLTTETDGSTSFGDTFTVEIDVIDESTLGNTVDNITVRENQLGQIFDPDDVNFGLANPVTSYIITAGGDANKMKFETVITRVGAVDFVMGYSITFGNPSNNNTININFSDSLSVNLFNSYRDDLDYADADQEISHVLFGDTGLLLDPFDDLNIVVYEDVKPDLI